MLAANCTNQSSQTNTNHGSLIVEVAFTSYASLDPARTIFDVPKIVDYSIYDTLVRINPRDLTKPYPSLATSFIVSADGLTTTFHLRPGVKFASGDPLTSADVAWSLTRVKNIGYSGASSIMDGLTVAAPDPLTVILTSDTPNPAVAVAMTQFQTGILDSKLVQQHGGTADAKDQADDYLNSNSAGSGPYMLGSVDRVSQIVLQANPMYWGVKPTYNSVILRNAPAATQRFDIQDGQAQLAFNISTTDAASMNSSAVNVIATSSPDVLVIGLNANPSVSPLSANQNFRDAVRYGIDYKGLVALGGLGAVQATGVIAVGILGALPAVDATQRDVTRAKAALAQVGIPNPTIQLDYWTDIIQDGIQLATIAAKIQSDLAEVGIKVNLAGTPGSVLIPRLFAQNKVAMSIQIHAADFGDPSNFLTAFPGGKQALWFGLTKGLDPSTDALIAKAISATQFEDRRAAYQAVGKALNSRANWISIMQPGRALVAAKSVHAILNPFSFSDLGTVT
jgi:peptide/nickel transport system substrate-binding protein